MRPGASTRRDRALTRVSTGLGWASLGVLELTALPTIGAGRWVPWVRPGPFGITAATRVSCLSRVGPGLVLGPCTRGETP